MRIYKNLFMIITHIRNKCEFEKPIFRHLIMNYYCIDKKLYLEI